MLGCPHYTIEQIWEAARLLDGKRVSENCALWIFTAVFGLSALTFGVMRRPLAETVESPVEFIEETAAGPSSTA